MLKISLKYNMIKLFNSMSRYHLENFFITNTLQAVETWKRAAFGPQNRFFT